MIRMIEFLEPLILKLKDGGSNERKIICRITDELIPETDPGKRGLLVENVDLQLKQLTVDGVYDLWLQSILNMVDSRREELVNTDVGDDSIFIERILRVLNDSKTQIGQERQIEFLWECFMIGQTKAYDQALIAHHNNLISCMEYVDCAGKPAVLSELFTNRAWNPVNLCFNSLKLIELIEVRNPTFNRDPKVVDWIEQVRHVCIIADKEQYDEICEGLTDKVPNKHHFSRDYSRRTIEGGAKLTVAEPYPLFEGLGRYIDLLSPSDVQYLKTKVFSFEQWSDYRKMGSHDLEPTEQWDGDTPDPYLPRFFGIISAEPGYGKTIALQQYCQTKAREGIKRLQNEMAILESGLQGKNDPDWHPQSYYDYDSWDDPIRRIPIFVTAKNLAKHILSEDGINPDVNFRPTPFDILVNAVATTFDFFDPRPTRSLQKKNRFQMEDLRVFIDAFDECSNDEKEAIIKFIDNEGYGSYIFTVRTQELDSLLLPLSELPSIQLAHGRLDYSKDELNNVMPTQLALAWGQNEDIMQMHFNHYLSEYEPVLTHPVFIGLFCRLMNEGIITNMKQTNSDLFNERIGDSTTKHVLFYRHVIETGLGLIIRKRHEVDQSDLELYKRAFCLIAWYFTYEKIDEFDEVYAYLQVFHDIDLDTRQIEILKHDLTLLYAAGKRIKEIHLQVFEAAIGIALHQIPILKERMNSEKFNYDIDGTVILSYILEQNPASIAEFTRLKVQSMINLGTVAARVVLREEHKVPIFEKLSASPNLGFKLVGSEPFHDLVAQAYLSRFEDSRSIPFSLPMVAFSILSSQDLAFVHRRIQLLEANGKFSFLNFPSLRPYELGMAESGDVRWLNEFGHHVSKSLGEPSSLKETGLFEEYRAFAINSKKLNRISSDVLLHLIGEIQDGELQLDQEFLRTLSRTTTLDWGDMDTISPLIRNRNLREVLPELDTLLLQALAMYEIREILSFLTNIIKQFVRNKTTRMFSHFSRSRSRYFLSFVKDKQGLLLLLRHCQKNYRPFGGIKLTEFIAAVDILSKGNLLSPQCHVCGSIEGPFELDHVGSRHHLRTNSIHDYEIACKVCNRKQSTRQLRPSDLRRSSTRTSISGRSKPFHLDL